MTVKGVYWSNSYLIISKKRYRTVSIISEHFDLLFVVMLNSIIPHPGAIYRNVASIIRRNKTWNLAKTVEFQTISVKLILQT